MSGPPDWLDAPPPDPRDYGGKPAGGQRSGGNRREKMKPDEVAALVTDFYEWLISKQTKEQLRMMLPDNVDPDVFIATCKSAAMNKPEILREDLRPSLFTAVMKAAAQGLLPDGKQGALIARWDTDANGHRVVWQAMVHGIMKLGRETGAIKSIRAVIVFDGEPFRVIQGDEDRIEHEVNIDIADAAYEALNGGKDQHGNPIAKPQEFMSRVRASYCIITAADGTVTKRWMTRQRIVSLWEASKAARGPWNSRWLDEMILKGVILFTSKWINLDTSTAIAQRFQQALMTDMDIDFDRQGQLIHNVQDRPPQPALAAPDTKLSALEDHLFGLKQPKEKVAAGGHAPVTQGGDVSLEGEASSPDLSFTDDAIAKLAEIQNPQDWLKVFKMYLEICPTMGDLGTLGGLPFVHETLHKESRAPREYRNELSDAMKAAAIRLAPQDEPPLSEALTVGDQLTERCNAEIEHINGLHDADIARYAISARYQGMLREFVRSDRIELSTKIQTVIRERTKENAG